MQRDLKDCHRGKVSSCLRSCYGGCKIKILNLGCGYKISTAPEVINVDWSPQIRIRSSNLLRVFAPILMSGERRKHYSVFPSNILVHNLARGIPFDDNSVDLVYHSHVLEHLDRPIAYQFMLEVNRVLKRGGVHRIVVPDFEKLIREYLSHIEICDGSAVESLLHDHFIEPILEQSVRKESFGTSQQLPLRRTIENWLLGDARKRGETHQWMYDKVNLRALLDSTGFKQITQRTWNTSAFSGWNGFGLDANELLQEYKPSSLYMEALS